MEVFGDRESSQVSSDNKLFELAPHPRCVHFNPNRTDADKDILKVGLGFHQSALLVLDTADEREKHGEQMANAMTTTFNISFGTKNDGPGAAALSFGGRR